MKVVFIAIPTKGTVTDGKLNESFLKDFAALHTNFPDVAFIAPMVQDYQLLGHMKVEATYEVWGRRCEAVLAKCDEMWVMCYDGWCAPVTEMNAANTSVGVYGEICTALTLGVPVDFIPHPPVQRTNFPFDYLIP